MISTETKPYGEAALWVEVAAPDSERAWRASQEIATAVSDVLGVINAVATFTSVFVEVDLSVASATELQPVIGRIASGVDGLVRPAEGGIFDIPVCYGGSHGPDLRAVADHLGVSESDVVERHAAEPLLVRTLAGPIGGPMMSGPRGLGEVPRRASPRAAVWRGAVLLAGRQAFLKTMAGPGGWQIIGTTPVRPVDLRADPVVPWGPGDRLRFRPVAPEAWDQLSGQRPRRLA